MKHPGEILRRPKRNGQSAVSEASSESRKTAASNNELKHPRPRKKRALGRNRATQGEEREDAVPVLRGAERRAAQRGFSVTRRRQGEREEIKNLLGGQLLKGKGGENLNPDGNIVSVFRPA